MLNDITNIKQIACDLCETIMRKNKDYGQAFAKLYTEEGEIVGGIHIKEKANRIMQLIKSGEPSVANEPLEDALKDCAGYCLLMLDLIEQKKLLRAEKTKR